MQEWKCTELGAHHSKIATMLIFYFEGECVIDSLVPTVQEATALKNAHPIQDFQIFMQPKLNATVYSQQCKLQTNLESFPLPPPSLSNFNFYTIVSTLRLLPKEVGSSGIVFGLVHCMITMLPRSCTDWP